MAQITEIKSPYGGNIYIQYEESDELRAVGNPIRDIKERTEQFKKALDSTVKGYSEMVLNTVKNCADTVAPSKITLQFGLQMGGSTGVPLVTQGTAQANVMVTIEWELNQENIDTTNTTS